MQDCRHLVRIPNSLAGVAKLVDALDLGSSAARLGGSSPFSRTTPWRFMVMNRWFLAALFCLCVFSSFPILAVVNLPSVGNSAHSGGSTISQDNVPPPVSAKPKKTAFDKRQNRFRSSSAKNQNPTANNYVSQGLSFSRSSNFSSY